MKIVVLGGAGKMGALAVEDLVVNPRVERVVLADRDMVGAAAIAEYLDGRGERVSAYYTSNVEFYLFRNQVFDEFVRNVRALPIDGESVIIRSVFHATFGPHPLAVPGYHSTQVLQRIAEIANGRFTTYWDVVTARAMN